jgi:hypothetical protein
MRKKYSCVFLLKRRYSKTNTRTITDSTLAKYEGGHAKEVKLPQVSKNKY